jgi:hypothetical protein
MADDDSGLLTTIIIIIIIIIMKYLTKKHKREHVVLKIRYSVQGNSPPCSDPIDFFLHSRSITLPHTAEFPRQSASFSCSNSQHLSVFQIHNFQVFKLKHPPVVPTHNIFQLI